MTEPTTPPPHPPRPRTSPYLGPNREYWLHRLIRHAYERDWCTRPDCTTCGASKLRDALRSEAFRSANRVETDRHDRLSALHLAVALASLHPDPDEARTIEGAVDIAITELIASPLEPWVTEGILHGHWASTRLGSGGGLI